MLKTTSSGELVILSGSRNDVHWNTEKFIKRFNPELTLVEFILQTGFLYYTGMVGTFNEAGYPKFLMTVGNLELGDIPRPPASYTQILDGIPRRICQCVQRQSQRLSSTKLGVDVCQY